MTYGWKRAEILSAAGNGITLLVVCGIVTFESIRRLISPPSVQGGPVLVVALVGVAVNILARILDQLQDCLAGHFDVEHSTFQLEPVGHGAHEHDTHD